ncbi:MAG TPA: sulfatase-like hydrolase/transferase [Lacunisphaera sp.]|nr:sulfatase-like hydrolase/transferase [Lacunisphaera sp.]
MPEGILCLRGGSGLKYFAPIGYYECIVSFFLLAPGLLLRRNWSRLWVVVIGAVLALTTLLATWQVLTAGARWDITAHGALLQTNPGEAAGYLRAFSTWGLIGGIILLAAGFVAGLIVNWRARPPRPRMAGGCLLAGLAVSSYGVHNAIRYGGWPVHDVLAEDGTKLRIAALGINSFHPVLLLLVTDHNYRVTHDYYLGVNRRMAEYATGFAGPQVEPGAVAPRDLVVVIGESASRRHWSLYGYRRPTTPRLAALGDEVMLFSDVVSASVGTQTVLRGMFITSLHGLPVFPLFSAAGYRTHWFSAQYNQGENDVEVAALVQSCDERVFLNGAFDGDLIPLLRRALAEPGKHAIFLDLFGSHVRYDDRYPAAFAIFTGEGGSGHRLAAYDNSIRYTDSVLADMIAVLRESGDASCLLYVSDHAEDVYDSNPTKYLFRSDELATDPMYEVPFLLWFSPAYQKGNPTFVAAARAARDRPFQTAGLYHSLIDLARLRHPVFVPERSLFSPQFQAVPRHVGNAGRIYEKRR